MIWKPLALAPDIYSVSDAGDIRLDVSRPPSHAGALISRRPHENGRTGYTVSISIDKVQRKLFVHTLVAAAFLPEKPPGAVLEYIDGDCLNPSAVNLRWTTRSKNPVQDTVDHSDEKWRAVKDYPYEVSDHGRVRSMSGAILCTFLPKTGYPMVKLFPSRFGRKKGDVYYVHRLVAFAFIPNDDPDKTAVDHIDNVRANACAANLRWMIPEENTRKAFSGLAHEHRASIKEMSAAGQTDVAIARELRIGQGLVANVMKSTRWATTVASSPRGDEVWKPCPGFPMYEISSRGRCKNVTTDKILSPRSVSGYPAYNLRRDGLTIQEYAHTLVARAFLPPPPEGLKNPRVNHRNNDRADNDVTNLEWISHADNIRYRYGTRAPE